MKYLFIGAHLDDIELAAGGTIAKLVKCGHKVLMLCLSKSDYVNLHGETLRVVDEALYEGHVAAKILGAELHVLDFPTKDIPYNSMVVEAIEMEMSLFKPDIIFTHNVNDTHQAHISTALSTLSAARRFNTIFFYEPIYPSGRAHIPFRPDMYIDISGFMEVKLDSLRAHKSQYDKYGDVWLNAVKARAEFRGFENGLRLAECFEVSRMEYKIQ